MAMTAADAYTQGFTAAPRPVKLVEIPLGASAARTEFENYVPGLFVMAVVLMVFQAAMTPARDIESGALRRLRLTPLTAFDYLGGTSLWLALVSVAAVLLTFATAVGFGFRSQGPLWLALLVTAITSLSIIGIGLIVACFSKTVSQAFVIANFPLGFLMFLTGAAFPLPRLDALHALRPWLRAARPAAAHPRRRRLEQDLHPWRRPAGRRLRAGGQTAVPGSGPLDTLYGWSPDGRWLLVESSRDVNAMAVSSGSERLHKEDS